MTPFLTLSTPGQPPSTETMVAVLPAALRAALAPTATIANIQGVSQSIEPLYTNLYVKSNLSGEFTVVNERLVQDLTARGLWDAEMLEDLKYEDGSVQNIERIPDEVKERYPTAFEVDASWLIAAGARRQKWIDMGQSLNLYVAEPSGRKLNELYTSAWKSGLKTTYYLRSRGATQNEKSTIDVNRRGMQPRWMRARSASSEIALNRDSPAPAPADPVAACAAPAPATVTTVPVAGTSPAEGRSSDTSASAVSHLRVEIRFMCVPPMCRPTASHADGPD